MGEIIPRPVPPKPLAFTGERLTSEYGGQTQIEHFHRYLLVREWCRGRDILDVASGEGYGTALLAQVARNAVGVDISFDAVLHATGAYRADNLSFVRGDARDLPLPDASRDVIVSFETVEHIAEQQRFLEEVRRILRPDGLLVVSTPDRDNYSPSESPVNPYHVKELTSAEFAAELRAYFSEVSVLFQRPVFGSVIFSTVAGYAAVPLCFERRGAGHFEASVGLSRPQYMVAFASNRAISALPSSVYIDTGQLGMLNPTETASLLADANASCTVERDRADAAEAENNRFRDEANAYQARLAGIEADLNASQSELTAARGETRGLLVANEMAEQACTVLRSELSHAREAIVEQARAAMRSELSREALSLEEVTVAKERAQELEKALLSAKAEITDIRASHSWRVTAPVRRISRILYRRP